MVGVDTASNKYDCIRLDPITRKTLLDLTVPRTEEGIDTLFAEIPPDVEFVVEPTGRYSMLLVERAAKVGRRVLLAPNRRAKAFIRSVNPRAKTDKIDARGLALFGLSQDLDPYVPKPKHVDQLDQLLSTRKLLNGHLAAETQAAEGLPLVAEHLKASVAALQARVKLIDDEIKNLVKNDPDLCVARSLDEIPGVGPICAAAVASRLKGKNFSHPDKFVAYCGLDIGVHQSGKHKGDTGITKQGDAELRRLLYLAAMANLRCKESPFKDQYHREIAKGLPVKAALCSVARKIAGVCWSMVAHNSSYDAARVGQAPARVPPSAKTSGTL
jgi:transposase